MLPQPLVNFVFTRPPSALAADPQRSKTELKLSPAFFLSARWLRSGRRLHRHLGCCGAVRAAAGTEWCLMVGESGYQVRTRLWSRWGCISYLKWIVMVWVCLVFLSGFLQLFLDDCWEGCQKLNFWIDLRGYFYCLYFSSAKSCKSPRRALLPALYSEHESYPTEASTLLAAKYWHACWNVFRT